jgi:hypothetical protein
MTLRQRDWPFMLALALAAFALRVPFVTRYLYHWDSVNFALSLDQYDVRAHQPHPPGYVLYSALGRLVNAIYADANLSLVVLSLIGGVAGVVTIYWLGGAMFDRRTGLVAALVTLTSPAHWFHSEIALTYTVEFALVTIVAGLCYAQLSGDRRVWLPLAVAFGVAGGVRQTDLIFLAPLWLVSLYPLAWRQRVGSALALLVCIAAWAIPMVASSGGVGPYAAALRTAGDVVVTESPVFVLTQVVLNASRLAMYVAYGIGLGVLILAASVIAAAPSIRTAMPSWIRDRRVWTLALWIGPAVVFGVFMHIRQPGHVFVFLPALIVVLAHAIGQLSDTLFGMRANAAVAVLVGAILFSNAAFFLAAPASLFGSPRLPLQTTSRRTLALRDRVLHERIAYVRGHFDPAATMIVAGGWDFRHPDYYFREFQSGGRACTATDQLVNLPPQVKGLVLFNEQTLPDFIADVPEQRAELSGGVRLRFYTWEGAGGAQLSRRRLQTKPHAGVGAASLSASP